MQQTWTFYEYLETTDIGQLCHTHIISNDNNNS